MAQEKIDKRILHTEKLLKDAFMELLKEKPVAKITPTELCRKAQINRNTFYCHYKTVEDLALKIENDLVQGIDENLTGSNNLTEALTKICESMRNNKILCKTLFGKNFDTGIVKKVFTFIHDRNMDIMSNDNSRLSIPQREMLSAFTMGGAAALLGVWVENDMKEEPAEIAKFITSLLIDGLRGLNA